MKASKLGESKKKKEKIQCPLGNLDLTKTPHPIFDVQEDLIDDRIPSP
jgi:hypothetical protein